MRARSTLLLLVAALCSACSDSGSAAAGGNVAAPVAPSPAAPNGAAAPLAPAGTPAPGAAAAAAGAAAPAPSAATFSRIYQEIIVGTGCNGGPTCHASTVGGQLKLTTQAESYAALVGVKAMGLNLPPGGTNCRDTTLIRVTAGDPQNSLFLTKVEQAMPACGVRMPIGGTLMPAQIELIRQWIAAGAKND